MSASTVGCGCVCVLVIYTYKYTHACVKEMYKYVWQYVCLSVCRIFFLVNDSVLFIRHFNTFDATSLTPTYTNAYLHTHAERQNLFLFNARFTYAYV